MSINIAGLALAKGEHRQVREFINSPQGTIEIYEPTASDLEAIIELQRSEGIDGSSGTISIEGALVVRGLMPLLTNINLGELTDEELQDIINRPTVHLIIAQQYIAQIVAEANKLFVEKIRTEMMNTESTLSQVDLIKAIPALIMENAAGEGKLAELTEKAEQVGVELEEAIRKEQELVDSEDEQAESPVSELNEAL